MYRSPFRIVDANVIPTDNGALRSVLNLEKKKLLAEFEIAGSTSISFQGQELHRQDVLSLFEELNSPDIFGFHRAIWGDKDLLYFLEEAQVRIGHYWASNDLYDEPDFLQFISPYYALAYNKFLQAFLNNNRTLYEFDTLFRNGALILDAAADDAFRYATRYFLEKKNELLVVSYKAKNGEKIHLQELRQIFSDDQIYVLNHLPDGFMALRYELTNILNNLCVVFDKKSLNKEALAVIERAATIHQEDEELKNLVPANLRIIRSKQDKGIFRTNPNTGKRTINYGWIIFLLIIVIRLGIVGDACNNYSQKSEEVPILIYDSAINKQEIRKILNGEDSVFSESNNLDSIMKIRAKTPLVGSTPEEIRKADSSFQEIIRH